MAFDDIYTSTRLFVCLFCGLFFFSSLLGSQSVQQVLSFRTPVINQITNIYPTQNQMKNRLSIYWETTMFFLRYMMKSVYTDTNSFLNIYCDKNFLEVSSMSITTKANFPSRSLNYKRNSLRNIEFYRKYVEKYICSFIISYIL